MRVKKWVIFEKQSPVTLDATGDFVVRMTGLEPDDKERIAINTILIPGIHALLSVIAFAHKNPKIPY